MGSKGGPQFCLENKEAELDEGVISCGWEGGMPVMAEKKNLLVPQLKHSSIIKTSQTPSRGGWAGDSGVPGGKEKGPSPTGPYHTAFPEQDFCLTSGEKGVSLRTGNLFPTLESQEGTVGEGKARERCKP